MLGVCFLGREASGRDAYCFLDWQYTQRGVPGVRFILRPGGWSWFWMGIRLNTYCMADHGSRYASRLCLLTG
jgi:hypothetical protein